MSGLAWAFGCLTIIKQRFIQVYFSDLINSGLNMLSDLLVLNFFVRYVFENFLSFLVPHILEFKYFAKHL